MRVRLQLSGIRYERANEPAINSFGDAKPERVLQSEAAIETRAACNTLRRPLQLVSSYNRDRKVLKNTDAER